VAPRHNAAIGVPADQSSIHGHKIATHEIIRSWNGKTAELYNARCWVIGKISTPTPFRLFMKYTVITPIAETSAKIPRFKGL